MRLPWTHTCAAWQIIVLRFVPALGVLSLIWEFGHFPLYTLWESGAAGEIAYAALHCTVGDVLIGTGALMLALIATRAGPPATWRLAPIAAVTVTLAVAYTVFSEWMNVEWREGWAYAPAMPTLPVIGTGATPLLQWFVVPSLALWLAVARARLSRTAAR